MSKIKKCKIQIIGCRANITSINLTLKQAKAIGRIGEISPDFKIEQIDINSSYEPEEKELRYRITIPPVNQTGILEIKKSEFKILDDFRWLLVQNATTEALFFIHNLDNKQVYDYKYL